MSFTDGTARSLWLVIAALFALLFVMSRDRMMVEDVWQWWLGVWGLIP